MERTSTFEDYEQEYSDYLSKIRSFLAGSRTRTTLQECQQLLRNAKQAAISMQGIAEVEGNTLRIQQAKNLLERDIAPLSREVQYALNKEQQQQQQQQQHQQVGATHTNNREELFYQAPDIENSSSMDALIQSSEDLLRDSQSVLVDTEQIGNSTLRQMGQQREQLLNANSNLARVQEATQKAKAILKSMSRRVCRSRLSLYSMIACLGAANLFVLYLIYKKHHPTKSNDDDDDDDTNDADDTFF